MAVRQYLNDNDSLITLIALPNLLKQLTPDFDCDISFCDFSHVEANSWNHVFTEVTALRKEKANEIAVKQHKKGRKSIFWSAYGPKKIATLFTENRHEASQKSLISVRRAAFSLILFKSLNDESRSADKQRKQIKHIHGQFDLWEATW